MNEYQEPQKYFEKVSLSTQLERGHELERDRPKTIEGHIALFHNLSDPGFVAEFRRRIMAVADSVSSSGV